MNTDHDVLAKPGIPQNSPSNKFILKIKEEVVENNKYLKFIIVNKLDGQIFNSNELFDIRHNSYFLWDEFDNVWVYSGDTGTYVWKYKQSNWVRQHYSEIDTPPPNLLIITNPKVFRK